MPSPSIAITTAGDGIGIHSILPGKQQSQEITTDLPSLVFHSMLKAVEKSRQMQAMKRLKFSTCIPFWRLCADIVLVVSEVLTVV
jgi:hypothetical protein